ncbi:homocysteine S-methyltransferase family protein [Sneathiella marina]|uniref:Homocysteine S-methyltransferase family protein n=1 Tax=Sneathiella marina TaxID=2950108 RepID=A0ABY4W1G3_9PROT|nr:homocysteine S-methyltransferase family protein [Sneathiella marina]USG60802.1 homocysteine S-methyltransferase family protein [Sneathiella marina]
MADITLLDGSIGQEIVNRSEDRATPLWSTAVMMENPEIVADVHRDYFKSGATIATTNTYAVHRDRLRPENLEDQFDLLLDNAMTMAEQARRSYSSARIALSLGPLVASYRPETCPIPEIAESLYREIISKLADRADIVVAETMSSLRQAEGALRAMQGSEKLNWVAMTVDDFDGTKLRSGEPLSHMQSLVDLYQPDALLINCSRPEAVSAALEILNEFGKPFGAYANGFTKITKEFLVDSATIEALHERDDLGPEAYGDFAMGWVAQGATIIGGCCEIGPDHISEIARRLKEGGHSIR